MLRFFFFSSESMKFSEEISDVQLGLVQEYTYPNRSDTLCTTSHQIGWGHPLAGVLGGSLMVDSQLLNAEPVNPYTMLSSVSHQPDPQYAYLWPQQGSREPTIMLKVHIYPLIISGRARPPWPLPRFVFFIGRGPIRPQTRVLIVESYILYIIICPSTSPRVIYDDRRNKSFQRLAVHCESIYFLRVMMGHHKYV